MDGLQRFWILSETERLGAADSEEIGARKLIQRLQIQVSGSAFALAAASRDNFVHFAWKACLQCPQWIGFVSLLMVRLHRWHERLGCWSVDCWLVSAAVWLEDIADGLCCLHSQDGLRLYLLMRLHFGTR